MRSSTLRLAWRNLGRNRKRTGLALAAIGLGQFALLAMSGITRGYTDAMLETVTGPMVGHVQIHAPGWRDEQSLELSVTALDARLDALREEPGVARASARIYAPALVAVTRDAQ
ncbi:MAG TPA: ABC transporter permease, partial [Armatimonadota bacterium]|nr:ABC transporter permease [Armatimonadota bacterium]